MGQRRRWTISATCAHPGCRERTWWEFELKRDLEREVRWRRRLDPEWPRSWKCARHSNPGNVITPDNPDVSVTLEVYEDDVGRYFRPEGSDHGGCGYEYGFGLRSWSKDFLPGTKLHVRAVVEPPSDEKPDPGVKIRTVPVTCGGEKPNCPYVEHSRGRRRNCEHPAGFLPIWNGNHEDECPTEPPPECPLRSGPTMLVVE